MLNLEPLPKTRALAVLHFRSLAQAMEATVAVLEHQPAAIELVDRTILDRARSSLGFARRMTFLEGDPQALLLVELFGDSDSELRSRMDSLERDMSGRGLSYACVRAVSPGHPTMISVLKATFGTVARMSSIRLRYSSRV